MTLSVIGAGFGRTGTESMKRALEQLGLGPCHHMYEVIEDPRQKEIWRSIASGNAHNWDEVFTGYQSAVDWPPDLLLARARRAFPGREDPSDDPKLRELVREHGENHLQDTRGQQ